MKKSKYFHYSQIKENVYAVFNSLILEVVYINENDFNYLLNNEYNQLEDKLLNELVNKGIIIENSESDETAYKILNDYYLKNTKRIDTIYLVVSQGCNLGCKYCFLENCDGNWQNKMMDFEIAKISIDKYAKYIQKNNIKDPTIMLFGGEPLFNWKLVKQIVEYCHNNYPELFNNEDSSDNIAFRMVTNGTLITNEKAKFMKKYNIVCAISLDGPKKINDENRVFKNSSVSVYDSVQKAIKILKVNECDFGLSITLSPVVVDDMENIVEWLKDMDIKNIYFNPLHYDTNNDDWEEHYKKSTKFIIDSFYKLLDSDIVNGRPIRQINSFVKKAFYFADCGSAGLNQLTIKPDGEVRVCQCDYSSSENHLGNIKDDEIEEILKNKNGDRWVEAIPLRKEKCLNCESLFICGGSCLTQNTNMFDNSCVDQTYCIYIKIMFEWLLKQWYEEREECYT